MTNAVSWVAADWQSTRLQLWLMDKNGDVLHQTDSDNTIGPSDFEPTLLDLLTPHLPQTGALDVVCCGGTGAQEDRFETPYRQVPCKADTVTSPVHTKSPRLKVYVVHGVSQKTPPDIMHGRETTVAGFLSLHPDFDGVLCLPSAHTKWVHISAGEIVSFRSFMTGELFDLLANHSALRHAVTQNWDNDAFNQALDQAMSRPAAMAAELFSIGAEAVIENPAPTTAQARLSGILIGMELAAARPYWLGQMIALIGQGPQADAYAHALTSQGLTPTVYSIEETTLTGLRIAYQKIAQSS